MTEYFKNLGNIVYDYTIRTDKEPIKFIVQNILTRVAIRITDTDKQILCMEYLIGEDETPEIIADNLYNNPNLHWTIMYVNNIFDLANQWPLRADALKNYCIQKYGENEVNTIHHTEKIPEMVAMSKDFALQFYSPDELVDITNFDYESRLNDLKRFIIVVKPAFIHDFVKKYTGSLIQ